MADDKTHEEATEEPATVNADEAAEKVAAAEDVEKTQGKDADSVEKVEEKDDEPSEETDAADEGAETESTEDAEEAEPAKDDAAKDSADDEAGTWQSKHDQRVAAFASFLEGLAAKGEEVMATLNAKADSADAAYEETSSTANARVSNFAKAMQARVEKAATQFAHDLDVVAQAVFKQDAADAEAEADDGKPYEPHFTPAAEAFREQMGVGTDSDLLLLDPEFVERFANFAFDNVVSDVDLPNRTRFICWLATLVGCQGIDEYRVLLPAALNMGVEAAAVKELVYQASAYLGIGRVYPFLVATNDALMEAGIDLPLKSQATTKPTEESRYAGGEQAQVQAFGEHMQGFKDKGNAAYPYLNQWLVKNCFGDWYTRGALSMAERELITFCFLAAQGGCEKQLRSHTAANINCGNDRAFLIKVVTNNVPFIGYPRSLNALAVVEEVGDATE